MSFAINSVSLYKNISFALLFLGLASSLPTIARAAERVSVIQSVEAAFAYNPELKSSQENQQGAAYGIDKAKAGYLPTIGTTASTGLELRDDPNTRYTNEDQDFRSVSSFSVRLTQPIYHGGAIDANLDTRTAQFDSADSLLLEKANSLAFDAVAAHIEVLRRQELVTFAKNNVKEHNEILNTVRQRYNSKIATAGELHQIEGRVSRAKATLSAYMSALNGAESSYLRVTGSKPKFEFIEAALPKTLYKNVEEIRNSCLVNNPRLKAALADVRASVGERDGAKSKFLPKVDLSVGPRWGDNSGKGSTYSTSFDATAILSWEFYSGGADVASVDMSSAKIRQNRQNLHSIMNNLNEDIETTFSRYLSAKEQYIDFTAAKKSSKLSGEDFYRQFQAAQRTLLDVLDAKNDFFYAASQQSLTKGDIAIAAYRVLALSGEILNELRIDPALLRIKTATTTDSSAGMGTNTDLSSFKSPLNQNNNR